MSGLRSSQVAAAAGVNLQTLRYYERRGLLAEPLLAGGRHRHGPDAGLRSRAEAKLAEVETKIADLRVIAATLRAAVDAGCDDLVVCAGEPGCPIPFATIGPPVDRDRCRA